jgi:SOS-response transcriptional repressor LexA
MILMQGYTLFGTSFSNNADSAINLTEIVSTNWLNDISLPATQTNDDFYDLEDSMFAALDRGIFFKVTGNSMKEAGVFDGDIAIVEREKRAEYGDIVIALVDGKYAIRYLAVDEEGNTFLKPANKKYKPINENFSVFGVVISVFRSLKK